MNSNTKKYDNRGILLYSVPILLGKVEAKPKPKTKININPTNYSASEMAAEKAKKGKNAEPKKPVNHWGSIEEDDTQDQVDLSGTTTLQKN